jgi:hypothetical protein
MFILVNGRRVKVWNEANIVSHDMLKAYVAEPGKGYAVKYKKRNQPEEALSQGQQVTVTEGMEFEIIEPLTADEYSLMD